MRDYSKVAPQFWTGETGRKFRGDHRTQVIALYLITCPSANMIGLYYLPMPVMCHEIGSPLEGASKGLRSLSEGGFAHYDDDSETVWVPEMAVYQMGPTLSEKDNQIKGIVRLLETYRKSPFANCFYDKYKESYHLPDMDFSKPLRSPFEAPSKPLRSQEQEQEQEQEQKEKKNSSELSESSHLSDEELFKLYKPEEPPVITIITNKGQEYPITQAKVDEFQKLYPALNVAQKLRDLKAWSINNPRRRKTSGGMLRFLNGCLARDHDKAHPTIVAVPMANTSRSEPAGSMQFNPFAKGAEIA